MPQPSHGGNQERYGPGQNKFECLYGRTGIVRAWSAVHQYDAVPNLLDLNRRHSARHERAEKEVFVRHAVVQEAKRWSIRRRIFATKINDQVRRRRRTVRKFKLIDIEPVAEPLALEAISKPLERKKNIDRAWSRDPRLSEEQSDSGPQLTRKPCRQFTMEPARPRWINTKRDSTD